jgi:hypothetical protein
MTTSAPLTDTQLVLLSAASQRDDGLLVQPDHLKGIIAQSVTSKLLARTYIEEVIVGRGEPHWRQDDSGHLIGFRITSFGLVAIGLSGHDGEEVRPAEEAWPDQEPPSLPETLREPPAEQTGTKRALVVSLLRREEGADLDDLIQATGWLPHTTRAALTGLRQKGYAIGKQKNPQGRTVYFIKDAEPDVPEGNAGQVSPAAAA